MKRSYIVYFVSAFLIFSFSTVSCGSKNKSKQEVNAFDKKPLFPEPGHIPQNVILLIGDGMGLAQIYAAMLEQTDRLNMESARYIGIMDTRSSSHLITDSGAGGTALACGVKTFNGAIGVGPDSVLIASILEQAAIKGMSTGIVVSCALTHATPASFYAHRVSRYMDSAIATDFYGKNITVALGGGMEFFDMNRLKNEGYLVLEDYKSLKNVDSNVEKLFGFYNEKKHPSKMTDGRKDWLPDATEKAMQILSRNEKGFFLMIEGSQIDWGGHDNDINYVVTETVDFDKTLGRVLNFAAKDGNTLVIVTADHETGALSILSDKNNQQKFAAHFGSTDHSAIPVPVLAWGPGAELFTGFLDNTEIPIKIAQLLGLK